MLNLGKIKPRLLNYNMLPSKGCFSKNTDSGVERMN